VETNRGAPLASRAIRYPAGFKLPLKPAGTCRRPSGPKNSPKGFPGRSAPRETHMRKSKRKHQMKARECFIVPVLITSNQLFGLEPRTACRICLGQADNLSNRRANQRLLKQGRIGTAGAGVVQWGGPTSPRSASHSRERFCHASHS
jgi:hypothetical protein